MDEPWGFDGPPSDLDELAARNYAAQMAHTGRAKAPTKKKYKKPEGDIQRDCSEYLALLGFIVMRTNAGQIEIAPGRWFHGVPEGYADLHCNAWGMFLAVETKAPKKGLRPAQQRYRELVEATGGTYIAPHSVEELRASLCAAYGPQRVGSWETAGRARAQAHKDEIAALKRKMGQTP